MSFRYSFNQFTFSLCKKIERKGKSYPDDLNRYGIKLTQIPARKEVVLKRIKYTGTPFDDGWKTSENRKLIELNLITPIRACRIPSPTDDINSLLSTVKERLRRTWLVGMSDQFTKSVKVMDKKVKGKVLEAVSILSKNPDKPNGNTIKPLTGKLKGFWRYRVGEYRLIYKPYKEERLVILIAFAARGSVY